MIQVLCLNEMHSETGYLPSAASTVKCIYGKAYPGLNKKLPELFLANRAKLQILENESLFKKLIKRSLYKYSHHLDKYLADLSWRISSSGANFLCMKGVPYETAFALNKSGVRKKMQELGFNDLARNYYNFYFCAWKNFMTKNPQDCRNSIIAGYYALEIMVKEARKV
jgi:hypothetical protein